jgi:4-hydroxy-2-oxoheptanedioate aldolase
MKYIRQRVLSRELLIGAWCNLGSALTVEMSGKAGLDWLLLDLEHGPGDFGIMVSQLQAASATPTAPIVRIAWNEPPLFKRVLDQGASGVMVPYINTAAEAELAASAMLYPPRGIRGVSRLNRSSQFGSAIKGDLAEYLKKTNESLLTLVQIETAQGVQNAEEIAAVEGVDVLFVGPLDLSVNLGIPQQLDHPTFRAAVERVNRACRNRGKASGVLLFSADHIEEALDDGFSFIGLGSDGGMVAAGMKSTVQAFARYRR